MWKFVHLWKKSVKTPTVTKADSIANILHKSNEVFKFFLNNCSWFVYLIGTLLILCCSYYYIRDYKRRSDIRRRRENIQRANERIPQRRRPGAIYRDHQIFRNAITTVRQYLKTNDKQASKHKSYVLKRTRSGHIYGSFSDNDEN